MGTRRRPGALPIAADIGVFPSAFIWIDDDAITPAATQHLAALGPPLLTISPDRRIGLEPGHIDRIEAFLAESPVPG